MLQHGCAFNNGCKAKEVTIPQRNQDAGQVVIDLLKIYPRTLLGMIQVRSSMPG